ncbi:hypothetical protein [Azospirillum soli]|uniref:hypothetical protein n=1 Tax=Azospirillum soli TaxID=1304799 RepID=UPI001AE9CF7D|nr:hypothetical protein [Azospirillum soli]MBP2315501.1 hypothetical protein [Azospirillum soli]
MTNPDDGDDLERDIAAGIYKPAGPLFARMRALVGDARGDLDAPLPDEDEPEPAPRPNAERVNDAAKRLMHRLIARRLPREPDLLARARARVADTGTPQPDCVAEWRALLNLPLADLRRRITERSEEMERLRSSSPLLGDGYYADIDLRRRIWRAARRIAQQ